MMKGKKYVSAWVPTWWRDTKDPTTTGVRRNGTYPLNPFKEIAPPVGSPDSSDVSDSLEPTSSIPSDTERDDHRVKELMEELMDEFGDVCSEFDSSVSNEKENKESEKSDEIIVVSDTETPSPKAKSLATNEAGSNKANSVGPSSAHQTAPLHHHRRIIVVDLLSDDEPRPVVAQRVATPPTVPTIKRGVPLVVSMKVIGDELCQQLEYDRREEFSGRSFPCTRREDMPSTLGRDNLSQPT